MKKTMLFTFIFFFAVSVGLPQYYLPYYGKNKVARASFNWKYADTSHFRLYYYIANPELINRVGFMAEEAYQKVSSLLNIDVSEKIPLIYYVKRTDFEQSNLYPGYMPPGVIEGAAEPLAHRIMVHGVRSDEELMGLLIHEITHIFEYEVLYKSMSASMFDIAQPPLWIMEGLADFMMGKWESFNLLTVLDAVLNDQMPEIEKDGDLQSRTGTNRTAYDFGHLVYEFLYEKFGHSGIRRLIQSIKRPSMVGRRKTVFETFNYTPKLLNYDLKKYAREKFRKFVSRENPEDYSFIIGPDFPFAYSFSHQISPVGELLAVQTVNFRALKIEIILISMKDGKVIRNITPGFTSKYDDILYRFSPADGTALAWNSRGEQIAFFARQETDYYLVTVDVPGGKILKKIKLPGIQNPSSPTFHPQTGRLYFTGVENARSFIYRIDLNRPDFQKVTAGKFYIRSLNIAADGKKVVYSASVAGHDKLFFADLETPENALQLTSGDYDDINPAFSKDGRMVFFSSSELEAFNICAIDLENRKLLRFTDVRTGNFFPLEIPGEPNQLVISSYHKGSFYLFKKDITAPLETRELSFQVPQAPPVPEPSANPFTSNSKKLDDQAIAVKPIPASEQKAKTAFITNEKKYNPFSKLLITALPPITLGVSTDGSLLGSSYLSISDLMEDHTLLLMLASQYGYRNYHLAYLNLKHRAKFYLHLFSQKESYYYPDLAYAYITLRQYAGGEAGLIYPFNQFYRAEFYLSYYHQDEFSELGQLPYGQFFSGPALPLELSLTGETTRFENYGPNMGHTFRLTARKYIPLASTFLDAYGLEADLRKYIRIDSNTLLAFRLNGFYSGGANSLIYWSGGNNTLRASDFNTLIGTRGFFFNAEIRFPLIHLAATPLGLIGPVRGVLFFDIGAFWFPEEEFRIFEKDAGLKLQDAISSYGFGVELFMLGLPLHFEWVYKTDLTQSTYWGLNFWIGFDF